MSSIPLRPSFRLSLRKKLLFSALTTVGFFVLLEAALAVWGIQPEADTTDRFVGFSSRLPLFEPATDEDGQEILRTAENKLHWFNYQSFPRTKPPGTKRVFCMGGSTTYGHPYWDSTSFAGWMRQYLAVIDPTVHWEVINAGGISYASYRVAALMEELAGYEPDLFVVYSVHNEFLERRTYASLFERSRLSLAASAWLTHTRVWTATDQLVKQTFGKPTPADASILDVLPGEVNEELNHTVGPVDYHRDPEWRAKVLLHYEANLGRMVTIARRAGAKIVFITPASNEKNCSPFKSEFARQLSPDLTDRFHELMWRAEDALREKKPESALAELEEARTIDDGYAELHYRLGQVELALGRQDQARRSFRRALNEDVCPLRAVDEIGETVVSVSAETHTPVVDFAAKLRQLCAEWYGSSIFGEEIFLDHVHPTIEVNRSLALWIVEELQKQRIVGGVSVSQLSASGAMQEVHEQVLSQLDRQAEAFALRNLAKVLHWAGKFEEAIPRALDTLDLIPDDPEARYIVASCLRNLGHTAEALEAYELLFADGVGFPRAYLPYGELLAATGQLEQAKAYLLLAVLRNPDSAGTYAVLGTVHMQLGEYQFAKEAFEECLRRIPNDSQISEALAEANKMLATEQPAATADD